MVLKSGYVTVRVVMKDLLRTFSYILPATIRVLFYALPSIIQLTPTTGDVGGGTEVFIEGNNLDVSYGGIFCRFGDQIVNAILIEQQNLIKCILPPW